MLFFEVYCNTEMLPQECQGMPQGGLGIPIEHHAEYSFKSLERLNELLLIL